MALSASCARPFVRLPACQIKYRPTNRPFNRLMMWFLPTKSENWNTIYCNKKSSKTFPYVSKIYDAFASLFRTNKKTLTTIYIRPGPIDWPKSLKKNTYLKKYHLKLKQLVLFYMQIMYAECCPIKRLPDRPSNQSPDCLILNEKYPYLPILNWTLSIHLLRTTTTTTNIITNFLCC